MSKNKIISQNEARSACKCINISQTRVFICLIKATSKHQRAYGLTLVGGLLGQAVYFRWSYKQLMKASTRNLDSHWFIHSELALKFPNQTLSWNETSHVNHHERRIKTTRGRVGWNPIHASRRWEKPRKQNSRAESATQKFSAASLTTPARYGFTTSA